MENTHTQMYHILKIHVWVVPSFLGSNHIARMEKFDEERLSVPKV